MRTRVIVWLRALLLWLDPPLPVVAVATPEPDPIVERARGLVRAQQQWPDRAGEGKRHQVYAALIDAFPDESRRRLSRAIEDAIDLERPA